MKLYTDKLIFRTKLFCLALCLRMAAIIVVVGNRQQHAKDGYSLDASQGINTPSSITLPYQLHFHANARWLV